MPDDDDNLLNSIDKSVDGITLGELLATHQQVSRRTAQRWISQWLNEGRIIAQGEGRARRYRMASDSELQPLTASLIPLSPASRNLTAQIDQPLALRPPASYQASLLQAYQPNITPYLSEACQADLRRLGTLEGDGVGNRRLAERLQIDLVWSSCRLEGNGYSRADTQTLLETGVPANGKSVTETQMILNHHQALKLVWASQPGLGCNRYTALNLHGAVAENLLLNPHDEGRVRRLPLLDELSAYVPLSDPAQIDVALNDLLEKAGGIADPYEQSFFLWVHLSYLQPFAGLNQATARLLANLPLVRSDVCPLTFVEVPPDEYQGAVLGLCELARVDWMRDLYIWGYQRSTEEYRAHPPLLMTEPDPDRLVWRDLLKRTIRSVVSQPEEDAIDLIRQAVAAEVPEAQRGTVKALLIEELWRLHEGALARYGLSPDTFAVWRAKQR